ncbi:(Na+)-NQR maturation NqrM [Psychrobacter sp.]|uniref:(Na+)-NQR maturation NqrM n=1 Tax=Psychrobacter sp. TaxID=56811 RepID=UPI0025D0F79B|nr:(Na+)-NQR maturation NqrM [Psychrobacter sp.]
MLAQLLPMLIITFGVFVLFFLMMGIGYMVKKEPLRGSCGRVANLMGDETCQFCGDDPNKCDKISDDAKQDSKKADQLGKSAI